MPSLQKLALRAATDSRENFLSTLGGAFVLVRLDERGGKDEPAPWAFHGAPTSLSLPPRDDDANDAEALRSAIEKTAQVKLGDMSSDVFRQVDVDEETHTAMLPAPSLPVPPARGAATVYVIPDGARAHVGRDADGGVCIDEMSLSRHHADILMRDDMASVVDAGSRNGTRVNGGAVNKTTPRKLRSGDVVRFGDVDCLFLTAVDLLENLPRLTD